MLVLVVDTNLFHEFRALKDLPWEELGEPDEVILAVTDPVQSELDEHKKSTRSRLKRRALEWTKQFRQLILNDQTDLIIREANPRVVVRLDGTRPDTHNDDVLNRSVADDSIVAIAVALRSVYKTATVAVFSDDLRPLRKGRSVGLDVIDIPEDWRREPEQTEEEKDRAQLVQKVAELRRQEPELVLSFLAETPVEKVLPVYQPLSSQEIDDLINDVKQRNPIETDFERARRRTSLNFIHDLSVSAIGRQFHPAAQEDITQYLEEYYPNWIEQCRERLADAHNILGLNDYCLNLQVELANKGTRPAQDLQLSIRARGDVCVMPDNEEETERFMDYAAPLFSLTKAPSAPQGEWRTHDPFASFMGLHNRHLDHLAPFHGPTIQDVLRDQRRDPNLFYYRDQPHKPVSNYSLTCEMFRHADQVEKFEILTWPSGIFQALDGKNAVVEVTANASNLTSPEVLKIPMRIRCEERSTYDDVRELIFPTDIGL